MDDLEFFNVERLTAIAEQRELWAAAAREKDMHGTASEFELTARIARLCIEFKREREKLGP